MNFRFTKTKSIFSIAIPLAIEILTYILAFNFDIALPFFMIYLEIHNMVSIVSLQNIGILIVEIMILYAIISLFQKEESENAGFM